MAGKLIILFAKAPLPGRVKTRLLTTLSPDSAATLHSAFVQDMICRFRNLDGAGFQLHTDIESDAWVNLNVTRKLQISGDLGLKMIHALRCALQSGWERVLLLGSDAPTLPLDHARALLASHEDIALGPAEDGGFYGIAASRVHAAMFDAVPWSHPGTLQHSIMAIERRGLTVGLGPTWFDVDSPDDLQRLRHEPDLPLQTAACLRRLKLLTGSGQSVESAG